MSRLSWSGWTGVGAIAGVVATVVAILTLVHLSPSPSPAAQPSTATAEPAASPSTSVSSGTDSRVASSSSLTASSTSTYVDDYAKACAIALTTGPASINGNQYAHAILQWAGDTDNAITVSRKATRFQATIGIRDDASDRVRAQFELDGDNGRQLFMSKILGPGYTQPVDIPLDGVLRITLRVKAVSPTWGYAAWGDARLTMSGATSC